uniref:Uncharacterized protein n=1 Tax=Anguilla anguilla TaxID=7936 RepID=A0A0E9TT61_ANGAN
MPLLFSGTPVAPWVTGSGGVSALWTPAPQRRSPGPPWAPPLMRAATRCPRSVGGS